MPKLLKAPKPWYSADVTWHVRTKGKNSKRKKRPIAYSTKATSDTIGLLVQEGYNSPNKILDAGKAKKFILSPEVAMVCTAYWLDGYGDEEWHYDEATGGVYVLI